VRFIRYPGEDHGNTSAANLRDQLARMMTWFDEWLAPARSEQSHASRD
jgi:dipeptidyl aminopeptidase/acylaminoacyl peptidase